MSCISPSDFPYPYLLNRISSQPQEEGRDGPVGDVEERDGPKEGVNGAQKHSEEELQERPDEEEFGKYTQEERPSFEQFTMRVNPEDN